MGPVELKGKLPIAGTAQPGGDSQVDPLEGLRDALLACLQARSPEVEEAIVAVGREIEPMIGGDAEGLALLRAWAKDSIDLIATAVEQGAGWVPSLSPGGAALIRYLARNGVGLDAVMRGFFGATSLLLEFLTEEIVNLPPEAFPYLVGIQSQHGDQLVSAISAEYENEVARMDGSPAKRIAERVEGLLAGEPGDAVELGYDLDAWHFGVIAVGPRGELFLRRLAERLGCQLLFVQRSAETVWAWLGASRTISFAELERAQLSKVGKNMSLAVGELRQGVDGWRLTHREAQSALVVMHHQPQRLVRAADVVLLAATIQDETARKSLVDVYLGPLDGRRDAQALHETLRVYFSLDCNAASTAAALGVNRHTVLRRLLRVEKIIGRSLDTCRAEMDVALRVAQIDLPPL
jgi:hypothetical protein